MSTDTEGGDGQEWTPGQLLAMDEEEARRTLPVAQYERWQKLHALNEEAEQTKSEWEAEAETVAELTVTADEEKLGTEVDLYGDTVLVRAPPDDRKFRDAGQVLDKEFGDDDREVDALEEAELDRIAELVTTLLNRTIRRWNGVEWRSLSREQRQAHLAQCREAWGVGGLVEAWMDVQVAIVEDKEEKMEAVESFLGEGGSGDR